MATVVASIVAVVVVGDAMVVVGAANGLVVVPTGLSGDRLGGRAAGVVWNAPAAAPHDTPVPIVTAMATASKPLLVATPFRRSVRLSCEVRPFHVRRPSVCSRHDHRTVQSTTASAPRWRRKAGGSGLDAQGGNSAR